MLSADVKLKFGDWMGKHFDLNHPVWTPVLNERGRRVVVHIFRSKNLVEVTSAAITNQRAKSWCGKVLVGGMYITRSPKSLSKSLTFDIERSVACPALVSRPSSLPNAR